MGNNARYAAPALLLANWIGGRPLVALLVSVAWMIGSHRVDANWPEFRGPHRDGSVPGHMDLPTSWSRDQNVRWRVELPGEGWSSPVVVAESVYLTAAIAKAESAAEAGYDLALLQVNAASGQLIRRVDLFQQGPQAPDIHNKNSHASPTPVAVGSRLYVHFGHQGTACTDLDGQLIWKNDTLEYEPVHGNGGSPVVVDDKLIFSRDGGDSSEITALHTDSGEIAWRTRRDVTQQRPFSFCTPLAVDVEGRSQVIVPGTNVVQSVDPRTGSEIWRVTYDGYSVVPRPIYESGLVFVCTGFNRPRLLAIDPTGEGDVTDTHVRWRHESNIPKTPSLVSFDGKVAMIDDQGVASCFHALTGGRVWKTRIGGNFSASPILAKRRLYLVSEAGVCTILDVSDEPEKVAVNELDERSLASPAVVGSDLLLRTSAALYRISQDP